MKDGIGDPPSGEIRKASRVGKLIKYYDEKELIDVLRGDSSDCILSGLCKKTNILL